MDTDVVISGAGPTGLLLGTELALAGVRVRILERQKKRHDQSRALTLHPRSVEILDLRGIADRFLALGHTVPSWHFAGLSRRLDFSALDTRHGYTLFLEQARTERLLEERARELGIEISYGHEVVSLTQDGDGVDVTGVGPDGDFALRAAYLVGCDGGRSPVRESAGIGFPGSDGTMSAMLGDFAVTDKEAIAAAGQVSLLIVPLTSGLTRFVLTDPKRMRVPATEPVTFEEFREALVDVAGTSFGIAEPHWLSRFGNATRLAETYRAGRVFLAGDAAHIHFPAAGQGLNTGLQDAMNLGWKLAADLNGWAPPGLLDTYHGERFPVGELVTDNTQVQTLLLELTLVPDYQRPVTALRELLDSLLEIPEVNTRLAGLVSALATSYPSPGADPLVGTRMPDLSLASADRRVSELMHSGKFGYVDFTGDGAAQVADGWEDRVTVATGGDRSWAEDVSEVLVRPDGHIAWVRRENDPPDAAVREARISAWAGTPERAAMKVRPREAAL
ncbi:FAD-dependent monooxygenase [Amycolatopsis umgeniensis]|uniref:2-polyprenyl-6-methoxyphenol hydroxylase-like FAD-dependent oxidoreductase n=1 Tax=Amycolatopsis umgeniensis TaxID=336628 RepID=A0A841BHE5_9PSEU|nr:FAD-dependent monooxygenase [Amycolatopsis umgeniensis]MBB5858321.1 2-polyprenyl-6-methoxyphenol hydroxylase-like FAD-dependent oxidoreductase [Amycolatopsis umgeniensis]